MRLYTHPRLSEYDPNQVPMPAVPVHTVAPSCPSLRLRDCPGHVGQALPSQMCCYPHPGEIVGYNVRVLKSSSGVHTHVGFGTGTGIANQHESGRTLGGTMSGTKRDAVMVLDGVVNGGFGFVQRHMIKIQHMCALPLSIPKLRDPHCAAYHKLGLPALACNLRLTTFPVAE